MNALQPEEWDFRTTAKGGSLPQEEQHWCCLYEYARELKAQTTKLSFIYRSKFLKNFQPFFPGTPWLKIPAPERIKRLKAAAGAEWQECPRPPRPEILEIPVKTIVGIVKEAVEKKQCPERLDWSDFFLFQIPPDVTERELRSFFAQWHSKRSTVSNTGSRRGQTNAHDFLKALSARRILKYVGVKVDDFSNEPVIPNDRLARAETIYFDHAGECLYQGRGAWLRALYLAREYLTGFRLCGYPTLRRDSCDPVSPRSEKTLTGIYSERKETLLLRRLAETEMWVARKPRHG